MVEYTFIALFVAAVIGAVWLIDRRDAETSENRRHWLRGDRWVLGKGWKADQ